MVVFKTIKRQVAAPKEGNQMKQSLRICISLIMMLPMKTLYAQKFSPTVRRDSGNQSFWCYRGFYSNLGNQDNKEGCQTEVQMATLQDALVASSNKELRLLNANLVWIVTANHNLAGQVAKMQDTMTQTNALLVTKVNTFSEDLRKAINARFDTLPAELANSEAIKQLKADILKQVDDEIAAKLKESGKANSK